MKSGLTQIKVALMDEFPDFSAPGFDIIKYNKQFCNANVIIKAGSTRVGYPEHWGGLSLKCAFGGNEYYESGREFYAVNDSSYLIFNEGKYYSSFIDSKTEVASFTVNFTPELERLAFQSIIAKAHELLDNPHRLSSEKLHLDEKLFRHDNIISPLIHSLIQFSRNWTVNEERITECMLLLLDRMMQAQIDRHNGTHLHAIKTSTRTELTKRLKASTEYLEANYNKSVSLDDLADVACLNPFYFLRQFKKSLGVTPGVYLQRIRMHKAATLLTTETETISVICNQVGFSDLGSFGKLFRRYYNLTPKEFRKIYTRNRNYSVTSSERRSVKGTL